MIIQLQWNSWLLSYIALQSSINWLSRYKHQLCCLPSFAWAARSIAPAGTSLGQHFLRTRPASSKTVKRRERSSMSAEMYALIPFVNFSSRVNFAASLWSSFFLTKWAPGSSPTLLRPVILWITSMFRLIFPSNHKYPS